MQRLDISLELSPAKRTQSLCYFCNSHLFMIIPVLYNPPSLLNFRAWILATKNSFFTYEGLSARYAGMRLVFKYSVARNVWLPVGKLSHTSEHHEIRNTRRKTDNASLCNAPHRLSAQLHSLARGAEILTKVSEEHPRFSKNSHWMLEYVTHLR